MQLDKAKRLSGIGEYYFSQKLREIDQLNQAGKQIINLGIGSPDLPPHTSVIETLQVESAKLNNHAYQSYKGSPILRNAIAKWYNDWYHVSLNPDTEILPLIGSKEGIMHICMTYLNEGDKVLIPNPGYPTYASAVKLAGAIPVTFDLSENNDWEPNFSDLENMDLTGIKMMWVNYPQMPTGKLPTNELFAKIIQFGIKHQILICHDNPYSFILNENPKSILSIPGAKEVAIELNSLSKSQNMAGWRVGMLCASKDKIDDILTFKSNMDSGMFLPIQLAAAKALSLGKEWYDGVNAIYAKRREKVFQLLDLLQCDYEKNQAGMFVWAKIPNTFKDGYALSDQVLYNSQVFITPGGIFGSAGNDFIRVSLCATEEKFLAAIKRIENGI
jgi:LL-diaminopimelate aminotransferase